MKQVVPPAHGVDPSSVHEGLHCWTVASSMHTGGSAGEHTQATQVPVVASQPWPAGQSAWVHWPPSQTKCVAPSHFSSVPVHVVDEVPVDPPAVPVVPLPPLPVVPPPPWPLLEPVPVELPMGTVSAVPEHAPEKRTAIASEPKKTWRMVPPRPCYPPAAPLSGLRREAAVAAAGPDQTPGMGRERTFDTRGSWGDGPPVREPERGPTAAMRRSGRVAAAGDRHYCSAMSEPTHGRPAAGHGGGGEALPHIDVSERGAPRDGQPQTLDRRLFMQLLVFDCAVSNDPAEVLHALGRALQAQKVGAVLYEDANDPRGIGVLTWSEDPTTFVRAVRPVLNGAEGKALRLRPELTMMGRTYSTGYEAELEYWLLRRPAETAQNPEWPWAVWYPLRRSGAFAKLDGREQGSILREHGTIGRAYGAQNLAHDIRLACHGLDARDNEFVIGLVGKELYPLSHIVQAMRKTRQTSEFISQMGPFFVGRAAFRTAAS